MPHSASPPKTCFSSQCQREEQRLRNILVFSVRSQRESLQASGFFHNREGNDVLWSSRIVHLYPTPLVNRASFKGICFSPLDLSKITWSYRYVISPLQYPIIRDGNSHENESRSHKSHLLLLKACMDNSYLEHQGERYLYKSPCACRFQLGSSLI